MWCSRQPLCRWRFPLPAPLVTHMYHTDDGGATAVVCHRFCPEASSRVWHTFIAQNCSKVV